MERLAVFCLFFSGAAALVYQVAWVRLLGLSMGATSHAIATVVAAFFLGMALGSALAPRLLDARADLRRYALLELIIALSAPLVLLALLHLDSLLAALPGLGSTLAGKFALALGILLVPTAAMGATFPVMAGLLIRHPRHSGHGLSRLYSLNTAGAVIGALACAFLLIPRLGLDGAVYTAAAFNLLVALACLRHLRRHPEVHAAPVPEAPHDAAPAPRALLVVLALTGFVAIATEVAWSKYLAIFTGTTLYGFAVILAAFLTGIAGGAWLVRPHLDRLRRPHRHLAFGLLATALALLLTRAGLAALPPLFEGINHMGADGAVRQWVKYGLTFLLLLPATLLMGALFPLTLKLYCGDGVRRRLGPAYAVNTLASIAGSLAAGFWLLPHLGTDRTLLLLALLLGLGALVLRDPQPRPRLRLAAFALALLGTAALAPGIDYGRLIAAVDYRYDQDAYGGEEPRFLYLGEGRSAVISLVTHDGRYLKLQANGLNESVLDRQDPEHVPLIEALLAYLPYALHPAPRDAFVIGFGGGVTTQAFAHTDLERIHVVELEPEIVAAARAFPAGPVRVLEDPRVQLRFNDARNTLLLEPRRYDLIASQPSHPWLAGTANLLTEDFFRLVRSRLREGGIFAQWINLFRMDAATLAILFRTFYDVFPHGLSFANLQTGDLILLGSDAPLRFQEARLTALVQRPAVARALAHHHIHAPDDLFWYFALTREEMLAAAGDAPRNRDTNLLTEVRLAALHDPPSGDADPRRFLHDHYGFRLDRHLPRERRAAVLARLGRRFLDKDAPDLTRKIIDRLEGIDFDRARALLHETLWWEGDWDTARRWYQRHPQWDDATHLRQLRIELATGQREAAEAIATRIQDPALAALARARLAFARHDWERLARLPDTPQLAPWRLVGLAHRDLPRAAPRLQALQPEAVQERPLAEVILHYHALRHDAAASDRWARHLVAMDDRLLNRYRTLLDHALDGGRWAYARQLIDAIARLRPDHPDLPALRRRLAQAAPQLAFGPQGIRPPVE